MADAVPAFIAWRPASKQPAVTNAVASGRIAGKEWASRMASLPQLLHLEQTVERVSAFEVLTSWPADEKSSYCFYRFLQMTGDQAQSEAFWQHVLGEDTTIAENKDFLCAFIFGALSVFRPVKNKLRV